MAVWAQVLLVFWSAYFQVFLLGLNSKLLRDDKIKAGFVVSWCITLAQFAYIWAVGNSHLSIGWFLFVSGWGGAIGITTAQYFYRWYDKTFHKSA
ncbi:holin [Pseudomonas phage SCYZ1]|nr:holin [Pseudomonas phage SCYZ1]